MSTNVCILMCAFVCLNSISLKLVMFNILVKYDTDNATCRSSKLSVKVTFIGSPLNWV